MVFALVSYYLSDVVTLTAGVQMGFGFIFLVILLK